jgi:hypothetical protein
MKATELFILMPRKIVDEILDFTFTNDKEIFNLVLGAVAQARKLRPVYLQRQPRSQRFATIADTLGRPPLENAADNLIRNWLLKKHAALLVDFLDGLKIPHDQGTVESLPETVEDTTLQVTVDAVLSKHPHNVVAVYLHAFNQMNGTRWPNLDLILQSDSRLQLVEEP